MLVSDCQVEMFHEGQLMEDDYTLMDVAYMFEWDRVSKLTVVEYTFDFWYNYESRLLDDKRISCQRATCIFMHF